MRPFRIARPSIIVTAIALAFLLLPARSVLASLPFAPGEKLTYDLKWERVTVATAVLAVEALTEHEGRPALHLSMTARSARFFDLFYKVRNRVDAYITPDATHSLYYRKLQREGSYKRRFEVHYDRDAAVARYTSLMSGKKRQVDTAPGTMDPLSILYSFRIQNNMHEGLTFRCPVSDGRKAVTGKAKVLGRETITVKAGTFDTWKVEPDLEHMGGLFKKKDGAKVHVWITADERRLPVKMRSQVKVGRINAELAEFTRP